MFALIVDLFQKRRQLGETKIFPVALFPTEEAEHFGILNDEDRILIGDRRVEERVGEPAHGGELFFIRQPHGLFAVNDEERIARNRVERFDATADEHRNFSELRKIDIVGRGLWRKPARCHPEQGEDKDKRREETFHASAVLLRRENPTR